MIGQVVIIILIQNYRNVKMEESYLGIVQIIGYWFQIVNQTNVMHTLV